METIVSIIGGVGLFLFGMAVMTDGLKALAGTALKTVLEKAAAGATLEMVASGKLTATAAITRVDAVALPNRLAHHAWRAITHLKGAAASRMEPDQ